VGPAPSASLPPNFTIPDSNSTQPQNTTDLPTTPLGPRIPDIPEYALTYAPIVYLSEDEQYWPSRMDVHLEHVFPWENYTPLSGVPNPLTLENLNFTLSTSLYLSAENIAQQPYPDWYRSEYGKPDSNGFSQSNVTLVAVNKTESIEPGVVDIFYFLFYSFNDGDNVGGQTYGNHISDIEYIMIRFYSGEPRFMFLSQHQDGQAYEWAALQKEGNRPIAYSATGGHANYPIAGTFELVQGLVGLLDDQTSAGTRWDLIQNYNGYWVDVPRFVKANGTRASTRPEGPPGVGYLQQTGKWGNQALPPSDPSQRVIFGQYQWSDGATGPYDPSKALLRTWLCVTSPCAANASLPASSKMQAGQTATVQSGATMSAAVPFLLLLACVSLAALS